MIPVEIARFVVQGHDRVLVVSVNRLHSEIVIRVPARST